jgi:nucleoside-diphosphate-sugar epimerase
VSTGDVFELLASLTGYERPIVYADERPGDIQRISLDPSKAARVWGWHAKTTFEEGLEHTVDWFKQELGATV